MLEFYGAVIELIPVHVVFCGVYYGGEYFIVMPLVIDFQGRVYSIPKFLFY